MMIETHVEASEAACPVCQTLAQRVQSHSRRPLHEVPCGMKSVRLLVRGFFCDKKDGPRKIFASRLSALTEVSARTTTRFPRGLAEGGFAPLWSSRSAVGSEAWLAAEPEHEPATAAPSSRAQAGHAVFAWRRRWCVSSQQQRRPHAPGS
jgi:hypothetical protein